MVTHVKHYKDHIKIATPIISLLHSKMKHNLSFRRPLPNIKEVYVIDALDMT